MFVDQINKTGPSNRMSLVSASGFIGGIKEYFYRGFQELPLVMTLTSLTFLVTTGSGAHMTIFFSLTFLVPILTLLVRGVVKIFFSENTDMKCSSADVCKSARPYDYSSGHSEAVTIPGFWLPSICFYFGYIIANASHSYSLYSEKSSSLSMEKRKTKSLQIYLITILLFAIILFIRFAFMADCEGIGGFAKVMSSIVGLMMCGVGYAIFQLSNNCGVRSSDLLGVLSQMLPEKPKDIRPVVCKAS